MDVQKEYSRQQVAPILGMCYPYLLGAWIQDGQILRIAPYRQTTIKWGLKANWSQTEISLYLMWEYWTHSQRTWRQCSGCNICRVFVLDFTKHWYFLVFRVRELWHPHRNSSNMLHNTLQCCGRKFFCKTKASLLGVHACQNEGCHQVNDLPLQVKA